VLPILLLSVQHVTMYHIAIEKLFYLTVQETGYIMQNFQCYQMKCMNSLKSGPSQRSVH